MHYDVGVIGGGVIGLSCAWRLAQSGARVAVFEKGRVGREASWAAAGMLAPQCEMAHHPVEALGDPPRAAMQDLCVRSRAMYGDFAQELFEATGEDVELDSLNSHRATYFRGIHYIATRADDEAISAFELQKAHGLSVVLVDDSIGRHLPSLANVQRAFYLKDEGVVNNRKLVSALDKALSGAAVARFDGMEVRGIQTDDFGTTVRTSGDTYHCRKILICAGAWSGYIPTPVAQILMHVQPIGGQMIALRFPLADLIYSSDVYLVPRRDGRLLVGATVEPPGFRQKAGKDGTVSGTLQLLQAACRLLPDLKEAPIVDQWAGVRPGTSDGLPILGSTSARNVYAATGHFRNGILLAPITAQLMADCIVNDAEPPAEFGIQRFASEAICASA